MTHEPLSPMMRQAIEHHRAGRLDDAEALYRQVLAARPNDPTALHLLGVVALATGRIDAAIDLLRKAVNVASGNAEVHCSLGDALQSRGRTDEAIAAYQKALSIDPGHVMAQNNLGLTWLGRGELDKAIASFQRVVVLNPNFAQAHFNLGSALKDKGEIKRAIVCLELAATLNPDFAEAHNDLGILLRNSGQLDRAIARFERAVQIRPDFVVARNNLGCAWKDNGAIDRAIACYHDALKVNPADADSYFNLGVALVELGRIDAGIDCYRRALRINPGHLDAHDNLLYTLLFSPESDLKSMYAEFQNWNRLHGKPLWSMGWRHDNNRDAERRLKVGYMSPDFRFHPVARFILPLLESHDRAAVEVYCYARVASPDAMTARLQAHADVWRSVADLADEQIADRIRQDRIDILVDLAMHTANYGLMVLARKPAPVQVTYLAYAGGTALDACDYRLTDRYLDPDPADDRFYMEKSVRLPGTYWCYRQSSEAGPVKNLPASSTGIITFGCLNNFAKVSPIALETWTKLLNAVPNSRLVVHAKHASAGNHVRQFVGDRGVAAHRIDIVGTVSLSEYLDTYNRIDIALDPFPYAGGTTTCDALWMGVPVVTLAGKIAVARAGVSILSQIGLEELIARTPEHYSQIAAGLASDLPRLANLRSTLRQRMQNSPLMDAGRFARDVESAYRAMWRTWCQS